MIDLFSGSLLLLLVYAHDQGWVVLATLALRVARGMMFTYMMRIFWQFFLFVRTDFYYVIASFFNCRNLLKDTQGFLRNLLALLLASYFLIPLSVGLLLWLRGLIRPART